MSIRLQKNRRRYRRERAPTSLRCRRAREPRFGLVDVLGFCYHARHAGCVRPSSLVSAFVGSGSCVGVGSGWLRRLVLIAWFATRAVISLRRGCRGKLISLTEFVGITALAPARPACAPAASPQQTHPLFPGGRARGLMETSAPYPHDGYFANMGGGRSAVECH